MRQTINITVSVDVKREIDRIARREDLSPGDVVRAALDQYLFRIRFRDLRKRLMARAQAKGVFTDEDAFAQSSS